MRASLILCFVIACQVGLAPRASAQERSPAQQISEANQALTRGDFVRAEEAVNRVIALESIRRVLRAEAYRTLGIIKFYQESTDAARAAFLSFLKLEPDGHLDPALVPPEVITLLEDVRVKNQAEIDAMRFSPPKNRYLLLNFVPAAGQIQNGESAKAAVIATSFVLLAGANVGSYLWLKSLCSAGDKTCGSEEDEKPQTARTLRTVNLLAGLGAISVYVYSVVDGVLGHRKLTARDRQRVIDNDMSFSLLATPDATTFSVSFRY